MRWRRRMLKRQRAAEQVRRRKLFEWWVKQWPAVEGRGVITVRYGRPPNGGLPHIKGVRPAQIWVDDPIKTGRYP